MHSPMQVRQSLFAHCQIIRLTSKQGYTVLALDYFRGDPVYLHIKSRNDKSNPNFDYEA